MKTKKKRTINPPDGFVFSRFADSAAEAVDGYSARAAELRVSGLGPDQVRAEINREICASFLYLRKQGAPEVSAVAALIQIASESICRLSKGGE